MRQQDRGRREGWYQTYIGEVQDVAPGPDGMVVTTIHSPRDGGQSPTIKVSANFIVDCTGLEADISEHRLLADLVEHSGAGRNVLGRLDVERTFEVRGTRCEPGRMYATGAATLGGYFLGSGRSISQWAKRMRGVQP
jgi:hypothetical protein